MVKLPWIARVYRYPLDKWSTPGRQALFGAPNLLLFFLCQKLLPFKVKGIFTVKIHGQERQVGFDARNTRCP
jgi:hypothetical protein